MSWTSPPDVISALRDALVACAAWTPGQSAVHYPAASASDTLPLAVLSLEGRMASIDVYASSSIGALQDMGYKLQQQLMSVYRGTGTGLIIASEPQASDVVEATEYETLGGSQVFQLTITADIGISFG